MNVLNGKALCVIIFVFANVRIFNLHKPIYAVYSRLFIHM